MLRDFNILATTSKGNETEACSELWYLLGEIGDPSPAVDKSGVSGLIVAKTTLKPIEVIEKLRAVLRERPYEFRYLLRVIPIEKVVRTSLDEIKRAAAELGAEIRENETYRVTVEKRFTGTSTRDIIEAAASAVNRKVNLENPDKVLLVEVIGGLTGMSVLKPQDVLSVVKEKTL